MRLIDADALIERLDDFNKWCKDERLQGSLFAVDVVGDMPTVCDIEQIRAEIEAIDTVNVKLGDCMNIIKSPQRIKNEVFEIIDKYTTKSEE